MIRPQVKKYIKCLVRVVSIEVTLFVSGFPWSLSLAYDIVKLDMIQNMKKITLDTMDDFEALFAIVSDEETMKHYPAPFDIERTKGWITWNVENYSKYGFGLWAVIMKETNEFNCNC